jgi:uncharacterized Fe-S cluster-containing radical SAM superfamily enzyme
MFKYCFEPQNCPKYSAGPQILEKKEKNCEAFYVILRSYESFYEKKIIIKMYAILRCKIVVVK